MACTFSTSQLPKVVRNWCALYILTWKCASRHNGVHFFISHLARWLRTRRFREPTFRPSGATNHLKNTVNRDFPTFSRICIFFFLTTLFYHPLSSTLLFSLPLPHLCFSSVHIVGSLTSKLPSASTFTTIATYAYTCTYTFTYTYTSTCSCSYKLQTLRQHHVQSPRLRKRPFPFLKIPPFQRRSPPICTRLGT